MTRTPTEALALWRASTGYSYRAVATVFGVTREMPRQWELGHVRVPACVQARLVDEGWLPRRRQTRTATIRHEPLCAVGTVCRSCTQRRRWQTAGRAPRGDTWTPEEEATLAALAGTLPLNLLAVRLTALCGTPRTANAVRVRLHHLGCSVQTDHITTKQVGRWCGVTDATVARWIRRGWLVPLEMVPRGGCYALVPEAVEQFLRAHTALVDWRHMPPSRWRDLVEMLWRRDPIYSLREAGQWTGLRTSMLAEYCRRGVLPAARITLRHGPTWRVRRSALVAFAQQRDAS